MNTGKALIGGAAVNNVVHSMFQRHSGDLSLNYPFKFFGQEFSDLKQLKDSNNQNISKNFASFLAAFVDNGKDPQAEYFNMNQTTAPVAYVMAHLGIPLDVIQKFLSAKIIDLYVKNLENENGEKYRLYNPNNKKIRNKYPLYHEMKIGNISINSEVEDVTTEELNLALTDKEETELSRKMLKNFLVYKEIATKVQSFVTAAKLGDQGAGPTQASNIIKLRNVYSDIRDEVYKDHESTISGATDFLSAPTFMTEFVDIGIGKVNQWIIDNGGFPDLTNSGLGNILNRFEEMKGYELTEKELRHFYENYLEYLAYGHPDFQYNENRIKEIEEKVKKAKKNSDYSGLRILEYMDVDDTGMSFKAPVGTDYTEIQLIRDSWKKLREIDSQLYKDLSYYAFQRDGFSVSLGSFTQYQPASIYIDNISFTDYLRKQIDRLKSNNDAVANELEVFKNQYIRNHFKDLSYIKGVPFDNLIGSRLSTDGKLLGALIPSTGYRNENGYYPFVKITSGDRSALYEYINHTPGIYSYSPPLKVDKKRVYDPNQLNPSNPKATVISRDNLADVINSLTKLRKVDRAFNKYRKVLADVWNITTLKQLDFAAKKDPGFLERLEKCS